jgi:hypothetical protein
MSEDLKTFLANLADFLTSLEEAARRLKEAIAKHVGAGEHHFISAPKPCNQDDPAIKWLKRKCEEVKTKHPESHWNFILTPEGKIAGLDVWVPSPEVYADYEAPAKWAFEKASQRPGT